MPGVIAVVDGKAVAAYCKPWVAVLGHLKGIKSPPQHAIAIDRACWQGEAVAAVVAETRAQAEDAADLIEAEWEELPVVVDMADALAGKYVIHPELGDNICFTRELDTGEVDAAFAKADVVVEETYEFGRHTGVTLEGRALLADYNAAEHTLTVYHSTQAPHMMQDIFSRHLDIPGRQRAGDREGRRRLVRHQGARLSRRDGDRGAVGDAAPPGEIRRRPAGVLPHRHPRARAQGETAARVHQGGRHPRVRSRRPDRASAPTRCIPRTSGIEGNQVVNLTGGPYKHKQYRAKLNVVFTNKNVTCQYRAVGHPIAVAITEGIVDLAAEKLGMDPAEFRRRNLIADDAYPYTSAAGMKFEKLSHHQSLDKLLALMDYKKLRGEQAALRKQGVYRGIGLAAMIEVTNPSPAFYGVGGARISAQDGATLRLEPTGMVTCMVSVTEQGQGTEGIFAQIAASAVGVSIDKVRVITGDTGTTPYGGGTWASRGAGIGGEAVLQSGKVLRAHILEVAAAILQTGGEMLDVRNDSVVDVRTGEVKLRLAELGRIAYFRPDTLPMDFQSELMVTRHYTPRGYGFAFTNGIQASLVEVDIRDRLRQAAQALVRRGLRHHHQSAAGRRADPRRHRAGHRRSAVRALPLQPRRPVAQRQHGGVPGADGGRNAGHRDRPRRHADQNLRARRQRRGRSRHRRRAGRGDERDQRCAAPVQGARHRAAVHAGAHPAGAGQSLKCQASDETFLLSP